MFAFAIWDTRRTHLLLARDRIGEKPLFYARTARGLAFASEIPALLEVPGVDRSLDPEAVVASLVYSSSPAPLTMFAGIRAVPPASRLTFDADRVAVSRYWAINCSAAPRGPRSEREAIGQLDQLFHQAVNGSLMADVPVGVLLSGGVDSSAIALQAARAGANVAAFSVAYDSPEHPDPDLARARQVAASLGLVHREIPFGALEVTALPGIVAKYAQPFNVFPMLYADQLARAVRQEVTVALGGNGADEAFGGYRGYNRQLLSDRLRGLVSRAPRWLQTQKIAGSDALARLSAAGGYPLEERRGKALDCLAQSLGATLFTPEFAQQARERAPGDFVTEYARECSPRDYLDTVMYSDLMVYHQHGTTVITDVSGMTHSLEIRAPFLDHRLLEFAFALPRRMKVPSMFRPNRNKYVLKRSLERALPHDVLYGRKYGFGYNIGLEPLLRGPWQRAVEAFVGRGRYLELGLYAERGARWAIEHSPGDTWRLLVFALWAELFVFGESVGVLAERLASLSSPLASAGDR
jgi:asparagine synthase (glutamine-hydrolysing)